MEIITSFTALNLEPDNLPKEASQLRQGDFQSVLKALQDAYCNAASDPDAYLYETVAPENIIFGLYEPEKVLDRLDAWNREIRVEFLRAIKNMCPGIGAGHLPPEDELPRCAYAHLRGGYCKWGTKRDAGNLTRPPTV